MILQVNSWLPCLLIRQKHVVTYRDTLNHIKQRIHTIVCQYNRRKTIARRWKIPLQLKKYDISFIGAGLI